MKHMSLREHAFEDGCLKRQLHMNTVQAGPFYHWESEYMTINDYNYDTTGALYCTYCKVQLFNKCQLPFFAFFTCLFFCNKCSVDLLPRGDLDIDIHNVCPYIFLRTSHLSPMFCDKWKPWDATKYFLYSKFKQSKVVRVSCCSRDGQNDSTLSSY